MALQAGDAERHADRIGARDRGAAPPEARSGGGAVVAQPSLHDAVALLYCPRCRAADWRVGLDDASCGQCATSYRRTDGVLDLTGPEDDPSIGRERDAAHQTERDPGLGGINDRFTDLASASGPLRSAILSLPHGDGSKYYREPGYFSNVHTSVAAFEFLLTHLDARPGDHLLDLGADLTWSTAHLARRGLSCTAVDINHHLSAGRLFFDRYGIAYHLIRADMSRVPFRDAAFDVVLAVNALHHASDLPAVAANISRMLRPHGRLAFIEPYCGSDADRRSFGAAQIDAGINEHTYLLQEWHDALTNAGLAVRVHRVADSFTAVYEKCSSGEGVPVPAGQVELFAGFYDAELSRAGFPTPGHAGPPKATIRLRNRGIGAWCPGALFPVRASYHLFRVEGGSKALLAFDNPRTPLPCEVGPGGEVTFDLEVTPPAEPGAYVAEVDLVHEGVRWFSERGMRTLSLSFEVTK